jgi:hypothetical protein
MGEQPVPGAKNIHERDLDALNALPAGIHLVSYGPKGPYPKNIWANTTCLQLFGDISLEEFLKEVKIFVFSLPFFMNYMTMHNFFRTPMVLRKILTGPNGNTDITQCRLVKHIEFRCLGANNFMTLMLLIGSGRDNP